MLNPVSLLIAGAGGGPAQLSPRALVLHPIPLRSGLEWRRSRSVHAACLILIPGSRLIAGWWRGPVILPPPPSLRHVHAHPWLPIYRLLLGFPLSLSATMPVPVIGPRHAADPLLLWGREECRASLLLGSAATQTQALLPSLQACRCTDDNEACYRSRLAPCICSPATSLSLFYSPCLFISLCLASFGS